MSSRTLLVWTLALACWPVRAAEYFIAPGGSSANPGSINLPWSMAHGLGSANAVVRPGDIIWLREGTYIAPSGGWSIRVSSADDARPIIVRNYRGERAIIDGGFGVAASNLWLWGLEVTGTGASSSTGYTIASGRNVKLINSLLYDNQSSGGMGQEAVNSEFYGNIIVRSGRYDADKCFGNSIYNQNRTTAVKKIIDCIIANGFLEGINIYSAGTTPVSHHHVEGNIAFGNGHCHGRNFLVGSDIPAENISVISNLFWNPTGQDNFMLCYGDGKAVAPVVRGNIFNGDVTLSGNTGPMEFVGNELYGGELHLRWPRDGSATAYAFDGNHYYRPNLDLHFFDNNGSYPSSVGPNLGSTATAYERFKTLYQTYSALSHFRPETHGRYFSSLPAAGARVIVRPNRYEPGRAHIAILNWAQAPAVDVDISGVGLPVGHQYELRAVQDYFGARVAGRYDGAPIRVPMTGWPVAQPRSPRVPLTSTFPAFGAFVLVPLGAAPTTPPAVPGNLQAAAGNSQVRLSWDASAGAIAYQVKRATTSGGPYTNLASVSSATHTDTTAANGTTYYYVVTASNFTGESAASREVSARPQLTPPAAPTALAATPGNGQVVLRWAGSAGATSYQVKRSNTSSNGFSTLAAVSTTAYTNTGLANGSTYHYVVSAANAAGESPNSSPASATPAPFPVPIISLGFDEPSGTTVRNAGSARGALTATVPVPARSLNRPSAAGGIGSVDFGAAPGNYAVETAAALSALSRLTAFTITGWINSRSASEGSGGNRIASWINEGGDGVDLVFRGDGSLQLGIDQWPDSSPARSAAGQIPTDPAASSNNWRFFAVTYDSAAAAGHVKFYFGAAGTDAVLNSARDYARGPVGTAIGPLAIGHFNALTRPEAIDRMFRGLIDEVKVFGQALSAQDIRVVQRGVNPVNDAPLVNAGTNRNVAINTILALSGTVTDDGLPSPPGAVSVLWQKVSGPGNVLFANSSALSTAARFTSAGFYVLSLTARDGELSASHRLTIIVQPLDSPSPLELATPELESLSHNSAVVRWSTDRPADSQVEFGEITGTAELRSEPKLVSIHRMALARLQPNTAYFFRVKSNDGRGDLSVSSHYSFTTPPKAGVEHVYVPADDPTEVAGNTEFAVYVPAPRTYALWTRVRELVSTHDSHALSVDGGAEEFFDLAGSLWSRKLFPLSAGFHRLVFRPRLAGPALDRLLLTDDYEFVPADDQLVAGVATARALTNLVLRLDLDPGDNLIANQLSRGANTVTDLFQGLPDGTRLSQGTPLAPDAKVNTFVAGAWTDRSQTVLPGEGVVIHNPGEVPAPLILTGALRHTASPRQLGPGVHLLGAVTPRQGPARDVLDFPLNAGDVLYRYDSGTGEFLVHTILDHGHWDTEPVLAVGESFYLQRAAPR